MLCHAHLPLHACREALGSGQLRVVCSGSDLPVIDLTTVSEEMAAECASADLIVLEGMGRWGPVACRVRWFVCVVEAGVPWPCCSMIDTKSHLCTCPA